MVVQALAPADGWRNELARLWRQIETPHRRRLAWLLGAMGLGAVAEVASLGALIPFLAVIADPAQAWAMPAVRAVADRVGVSGPDALVTWLTAIFIAAASLATGVRMWVLWATTDVTRQIGVALSVHTYERTLHHPYPVHVARNSSGVVAGLTLKINGVVFGVVMQVLTLVSSLLVMLAIVSTLLWISPGIAVGVAGALAAAYGLVTWSTRARMRRNSELIASGQTHLQQTLQDGLGGIRDIILDGSQPAYVRAYSQIETPLRAAQCTNSFIAQSPRIAIELLGMVAIASLALVLSRQSGGLAAALPTLGALALGAQRLLPALQQSYAAWQSVAGHRGMLRDVLALLEEPVMHAPATGLGDAVPLDRAVAFEGVGFRYPGCSDWVLRDVDLHVAKGHRVGVVGVTGSGKSTAMDLLMGLLSPQEGVIRVDGDVLDAQRIPAWQRTIAHVPQAIYLADTSVAENIAFGVERDAIDMARVVDAARMARIADHVERLPRGYETRVGERGAHLSGGQRQRLGIARALYKRASVLVLDEATSALDSATEAEVMDTIAGLGRDLTIVIIAHRISTLAICDLIAVFDKGRLVRTTTYDQFIQDGPATHSAYPAEHPA